MLARPTKTLLAKIRAIKKQRTSQLRSQNKVVRASQVTGRRRNHPQKHPQVQCHPLRQVSLIKWVISSSKERKHRKKLPLRIKRLSLKNPCPLLHQKMAIRIQDQCLRTRKMFQRPFSRNNKRSLRPLASQTRAPRRTKKNPMMAPRNRSFIHTSKSM